MSLINTILQASSVLMNSQNSQWQRERENERGLTALEIEGIRQEHQLKMTYLQQELQQKAREFDRIRQAEQRGNELINQAHLDGAKIRDSERYIRGTWKEAHFGNEQPPYVIFCINPLQDLNQFKDELARIAPFQRTYDNFKTRNAAYVGRIFSTITISETFKSEAEARSFFYRELNCPCIIVYGIFTGTGFGVYALSAGMSPEQLRIDGQKVADWGIRIEKLWDISYNTIHAIKQRATDDAIKQLKKKAAEMGFTLPTDPELLRQKAVELRGRFDVLEGLELYTDTHVGLCIQVMVDNYFSYFTRQTYEVRTPDFLEAKQKELTRLGIWDALKTSLLERYETLKGRQQDKKKDNSLIPLQQRIHDIKPPVFIEFDPKLGWFPMDYDDTLVFTRIDDEEGYRMHPFPYFVDSIIWNRTWQHTSEYDKLKKEWENHIIGLWVTNKKGEIQIRPYTFGWSVLEDYKKKIKPDFRFSKKKREVPYSTPNRLRVHDKTKDKIGFIDGQANIIIPFEYDDADLIYNGYVAVKKNNQWGLIDESNETKIPFELDLLHSPMYNFLIFCRGKKTGIMDSTGNVLFSWSLEDYNLKQINDNNHFIVAKKTNLIQDSYNFGITNTKGKFVVEPEYDNISYLGDNFYISEKKSTYDYSLINVLTGEIKEINTTFPVDEKGHILPLFHIEQKIDKKIRYFTFGIDSIDYISPFSNGFTIVMIRFTRLISNAFVLTKEGKIIEVPHYDGYKLYGKENILEGKILASQRIPDKNNRDGFVLKWGFYDTSFKYGEDEFYTKIPFIYDSAIHFSEGLAAVCLDGKWGYIDENNETIIPFVYEWAEPFSDGLACVQKDNYLFYIDKNNQIVIPFGSIPSSFENGFCYIDLESFFRGYAKGNFYNYSVSYRVGIINKEGKILVM